MFVHILKIIAFPIFLEYANIVIGRRRTGDGQEMPEKNGRDQIQTNTGRKKVKIKLRYLGIVNTRTHDK